MDDRRDGAGDIGEMVISDDVIAAIVVNAVKDIDGVAGFAPCAPGVVRSALKLPAADRSGVRVSNGENEIKISMSITVKGGAKIPALAEAVQSGVKNAVQGMTGRVVSRVDVSIAGVEFQ